MKDADLIAPSQNISVRSVVFFSADVSETVDYVLDQAAMHKDKENFILAVVRELKPWSDGNRRLKTSTT